MDAPPGEQRAHRLVGLGERLDAQLGAQQILEPLVLEPAPRAAGRAA